jgi:alkylated DNA repair dioxygenase AlkB
MMLFRKFFVKKDERALLLHRGDFVEILGPGEHRRFDPLHRRPSRSSVWRGRASSTAWRTSC